ncbi:hypothetical protein [uncultured Shewanella sp.]|uniref:hypothetical protein n=1 Tax=uncultured Shewanella sp. TaxID=173975 RepID=UPI00260C8887|nr:hypothetical protein [uncultured Shewanella sp.]
MNTVSGIVSINGEISKGKGFDIKIGQKNDQWTTFNLSLTEGENIEDYAVVCQQGPMSGGGPLVTGLRGVNLLEVTTWTQGVNPVLPAFNFIAIKDID